MMNVSSLFHGKYDRSGFCWHSPGGSEVRDIGHPIGWQGSWIDNGWAPRRWKRGYANNAHLVKDPRCCWQAEQLKYEGSWIGDREKILRIEYDSEEYPEGFYLIHHIGDWLANLPDVTLMSWWDRSQGDHRGGCSSSLLMAGKKTDADMVERLAIDFPLVVKNLTKAGVVLFPAERWTGR